MTSRSYLDDLGDYVAKSLASHAVPLLARQHIAFRASAVLLLYTVAEVGLLFAAWHDENTVFSNHSVVILTGSLAVFAIGVWQNVITGRIDYCVVNYRS